MRILVLCADEKTKNDGWVRQFLLDTGLLTIRQTPVIHFVGDRLTTFRGKACGSPWPDMLTACPWLNDEKYDIVVLRKCPVSSRHSILSAALFGTLLGLLSARGTMLFVPVSTRVSLAVGDETLGGTALEAWETYFQVSLGVAIVASNVTALKTQGLVIRLGSEGGDASSAAIPVPAGNGEVVGHSAAHKGHEDAGHAGDEVVGSGVAPGASIDVGHVAGVAHTHGQGDGADDGHAAGPGPAADHAHAAGASHAADHAHAAGPGHAAGHGHSADHGHAADQEAPPPSERHEGGPDGGGPDGGGPGAGGPGGGGPGGGHADGRGPGGRGPDGRGPGGDGPGGGGEDFGAEAARLQEPEFAAAVAFSLLPCLLIRCWADEQDDDAANEAYVLGLLEGAALRNGQFRAEMPSAADLAKDVVWRYRQVERTSRFLNALWHKLHHFLSPFLAEGEARDLDDWVFADEGVSEVETEHGANPVSLAAQALRSRQECRRLVEEVRARGRRGHEDAPPGGRPPGRLAREIAGQMFRGALMTGQASPALLRNQELHLLMIARPLLPGADAGAKLKHRERLRRSFWEGGYTSSWVFPANDLVGLLYHGLKPWLRSLRSVMPPEQEAGLIPRPSWPPPKTEWFTGLSQGLDAARQMALGPDAPLFFLGTGLDILQTQTCFEASTTRVTGWAYYFSEFFGAEAWDTVRKVAWRLEAASAVFMHAEAGVQGELAARLWGRGDSAEELERTILAPQLGEVDALQKKFLSALDRIGFGGSHAHEGIQASVAAGEPIEPDLVASDASTVGLGDAPLDALSMSATAFANAHVRPLAANKVHKAVTAWPLYGLSAQDKAAQSAVVSYFSPADDPEKIYIEHFRGSEEGSWEQTLRRTFPEFYLHVFPRLSSDALTWMLLVRKQQGRTAGEDAAAFQGRQFLALLDGADPARAARSVPPRGHVEHPRGLVALSRRLPEEEAQEGGRRRSGSGGTEPYISEEEEPAGGEAGEDETEWRGGEEWTATWHVPDRHTRWARREDPRILDPFRAGPLVEKIRRSLPEFQGREEHVVLRAPNGTRIPAGGRLPHGESSATLLPGVSPPSVPPTHLRFTSRAEVASSIRALESLATVLLSGGVLSAELTANTRSWCVAAERVLARHRGFGRGSSMRRFAQHFGRAFRQALRVLARVERDAGADALRAFAAAATSGPTYRPEVHDSSRVLASLLLLYTVRRNSARG